MNRYIQYRKLLQNLAFTIIFANIILYCETVCAAQLVDKIVAVINGDIITLKELNLAIQPYLQKVNNSTNSFVEKDIIVTKLKKEALNNLIDEKLTDQEAKRLNITVKKNEIDEAVQHIMTSQNLSKKEFIKIIKKDGLTIDELREMLRRQILRPRLLNYRVKSKVVITKNDIEKYYQANLEKYPVEIKYTLKNILLPHTLKDGGDPIAIMKIIEKKFKEGELFGELAKQYSKLPGASENKGKLGTFDIKSLSAKLQKALQGVKAGSCTSVLNTEHGYQIFYVVEIDSGDDKLNKEVSKEIEDKLYKEFVNEKFKVWISELRNQAHIKVME